MSHVVKMEARIKHLGDLQEAARVLGLVFERAADFRFWAENREPCLAKIRMADESLGQGEIGIRQEKDGTFSLNYDRTWGTGELHKIAGYGLTKLLAQYNAVSIAHTLGSRYRVRQVVNADGSIDLTAEERG